MSDYTPGHALDNWVEQMPACSWTEIGTTVLTENGSAYALYEDGWFAVEPTTAADYATDIAPFNPVRFAPETEFEALRVERDQFRDSALMYAAMVAEAKGRLTSERDTALAEVERLQAELAKYHLGGES